MKRETRAHLKRYRGQWTWLSPSEVDDVLLSDARLRAQVRDLKARVSQAALLLSERRVTEAARVLNFSVKNWRKP